MYVLDGTNGFMKCAQWFRWCVFFLANTLYSHHLAVTVALHELNIHRSCNQRLIVRYQIFHFRKHVGYFPSSFLRFVFWWTQCAKRKSFPHPFRSSLAFREFRLFVYFRRAKFSFGMEMLCLSLENIRLFTTFWMFGWKWCKTWESQQILTHELAHFTPLHVFSTKVKHIVTSQKKNILHHQRSSTCVCLCLYMWVCICEYGSDWMSKYNSSWHWLFKHFDSNRANRIAYEIQINTHCPMSIVARLMGRARLNRIVSFPWRQLVRTTQGH